MNKNTFDSEALYCNFQDNCPLAYRIGGEVVNGKEHLEGIEKAISIFGGARAKPDSWEYIQSYELAKALAKKGISVISGGGPGIMEAANKGAKDAKNPEAKAIGLNINILAEVSDKQHQDISVYFEHFASRKVTFCAHSDAFVVAPGGFGTLDELFEVVTLMQTHKSEIVPIILLGEHFWTGMMDWVKSVMVETHLLSQEHFDLIEIAKDWEHVVEMLEKKKAI
jgi:uncharacterized protein (TIGR00730 family)